MADDPYAPPRSSVAPALVIPPAGRLLRLLGLARSREVAARSLVHQDVVERQRREMTEILRRIEALLGR